MASGTISIRTTKELESILSICPGSTRTAQLMSLINFAIEAGFPTCLIDDQPSNCLDDRVIELEQQVKQLRQLKELAEYCKWAVDKHELEIKAVGQKLSRRTSSL